MRDPVEFQRRTGEFQSPQPLSRTHCSWAAPIWIVNQCSTELGDNRPAAPEPGSYHRPPTPSGERSIFGMMLGGDARITSAP